MFRKEFPENTYFTSDLHFFHKNLCSGVSKWKNTDRCRKFDTVQEMNDEIIDSINTTVGEDDYLIHLGDWSFSGEETPKKARDRINCNNIYHIFGNHCYNIRGTENEKLFRWVGDYAEIFHKKTTLVLSHYPLRSWNDQKFESIHLHGHCHGAIPRLGRSFDVGWDVWKKPISMKQVFKEVEGVPSHLEGHH